MWKHGEPVALDTRTAIQRRYDELALGLALPRHWPNYTNVFDRWFLDRVLWIPLPWERYDGDDDAE